MIMKTMLMLMIMIMIKNGTEGQLGENDEDDADDQSSTDVQLGNRNADIILFFLIPDAYMYHLFCIFLC